MKYLTLLSIILVSCAQVGGTLTGGEKDVSAPRINAEKSIPRQGQLNYTEPKMILVFDEFIVLKNPTNTISITPQPKIQPTITSKNKKFELVFNEPLLPNTTYSISFNGAITDFNEGNDSVFQYVFSTGSFIDSLSFSGKVTNSFTNSPEENILVGLYPIYKDSLLDSLIYKKKPTYITQTNKAGQFQINYIKTGNYKAYAFSDIDRNLLYNPNTESIAFLDSFNCCFKTRSDSNLFKLFEPVRTDVGIKSISLIYPGQLSIIFKEKKPSQFKIKHESGLTQESTERADSLIYWLNKPYNRTSFFVAEHNGKIDTLRPIMKNLPKKGTPIPLTITNNFHENKLLPNDTLSFTFSEPIQINDKGLIKVIDQDSNLIPFSSLLKGARTLQIIPDTDTVMSVIIDSAAVKSVLTSSVNNLTSVNYNRHPDKYYGLLIVDVKADSTSDYVVELLNMQNKLVEKQVLRSNITSLKFKNLLPGNYQLRLINDKDRNGLWSTGDLSSGRQPETIFYYTSPIKIRSNWDLDIEWVVERPKP